MTSTSPQIDRPSDQTSTVRRLLGRITRLEIVVAAAIAVLMLVLVIIEPNILEAPFENERTLLFTFGGTALAAAAYVAMLWLRVPALVRLTVLLVPFAIVNWWLLSPYFIDDVVDEEFSTSIAAQQAAADQTAEAPADPVVVEDDAPADAAAEGAADADAATDGDAATEDDAAPATTEPAPAPTTEAVPDTPVLLGAGSFVGLAGHEGTGDAGIFRNPDGTFVLRFENFDIENGPDLEVYLVPGADQVDLVDGSIALGALKGNIGDQTYELPPGTELPPGEYTALVWCEAFSVEFVGATIQV
ncbi:MAG: DM13 domain-containing protein [Actinomycetota bacterium]